MSGVLDLLIVSCLILIAAAYAFMKLAPRAWRSRVLATLAALAATLPVLNAVAPRLGDAARKLATAGGCGGCGDCGSSKPTESASGKEVRVPVSSLRRHR